LGVIVEEEKDRSMAKRLPLLGLTRLVACPLLRILMLLVLTIKYCFNFGSSMVGDITAPQNVVAVEVTQDNKWGGESINNILDI